MQSLLGSYTSVENESRLNKALRKAELYRYTDSALTFSEQSEEQQLSRVICMILGAGCAIDMCAWRLCTVNYSCIRVFYVCICICVRCLKDIIVYCSYYSVCNTDAADVCAIRITYLFSYKILQIYETFSLTFTCQIQFN